MSLSRPDFTRTAVLRGGALVASATVASSLLAAVITVVLGRELGDDGFGRYAVVIATASLLATIARLGLGPIIVRDLARTADESAARLGSRSPIYSALTLTTVTTGAIAVILLSPVGEALLDPLADFTRGELTALAVLFAGQALYAVMGQSLLGLHRLGPAAFLGLPVQRVVVLSGVIVIISAASSPLDAEAAIWLTALAASAGAAASGVALWLHSRLLAPARLKASSAFAMVRESSRVLVTNLLGLGLQRLPVWILAAVGTLEEVGTFALAAAFAAVIQLVNIVLANTLAPFVASSFLSDDRPNVQGRLGIVAAGATTLAGVASIGLVAASAVAVPRLFGTDFEHLTVTILILLIGTVVTSAVGPAQLLLNVSGNQGWAARASLWSVGLALVAIVPAAGLGGAVGAANVSAAAMSARAVLQWHFAKRTTGISTLANYRALRRSLSRGSADS